MKVGPKEAQRAAQRQIAAMRAYKGNELALLGGHEPGSSELPPRKARRTVTAPRKQPASEPKRIGRPPRLSKADYAALDACDRLTLATALKQYRARQAQQRDVMTRARARKKTVDVRANQ